MFAILAVSTNIANAQISDRAISESVFLNAKYTKGQVWDAQRSPAYPMAGREWRLSGLKAPLDANSKLRIDWGRNGDHYLMFVVEESHSIREASLTDERSGRRYTLSLKLFNREGRFLKTISRWGKLFGFGSGGFMYEQEGQFGTFFSAERTREGGVVTYRPELAQVDKLAMLLRDKGNDRRDERVNDRGANFKSAFLSVKYSRDQVWDAQRSPAYPMQGRDWRLSGLKDPLDVSSRSMPIDWGRRGDRYLMFVIEEDRFNRMESLVDDVHNSHKRFSISLQLFDPDGRMVKVISRWGKLIGFGSGGFMYEQEGRLGTFFTDEHLRLNGVVNYRTEVDIVRNLSAILDEDAKARSSRWHYGRGRR